jgi:hypothetical protein
MRHHQETCLGSTPFDSVDTKLIFWKFMIVRCKQGRKSVEYDMHWPKEQTMSQIPAQTPKLQAILALRYPYNTLDPNLTRGSVQLRKREEPINETV